MSNRESIMAEIERVKKDIFGTCLQELDSKTFDTVQADQTVKIFEKIVGRYCFIYSQKNIEEPLEDSIRKRKMLSMLTLLDKSDWTDPQVLKLAELIFLKIFTSNRAQAILRRALEEMGSLVYSLSVDE